MRRFFPCDWVESIPLVPVVPLVEFAPLLGMVEEFPGLVVSEGEFCGVVSGAVEGDVSGAVDGWLPAGLLGLVGAVCEPDGLDGAVDGVA